MARVAPSVSQARLGAIAVLAVVVATAFAPAAASAAPAGFVYRQGDQLLLNGASYRFKGLNIYWANGCSNAADQTTLAQSLTLIHTSGGNAIRAWFFQPDVTVSGVRNWTTFDNTLQTIANAGMKVIVTLANEYPDCGDQPANMMKDINWFQTGYQSTIYPNTTETYRDFVRDIAQRYANHPEILAWQLINEASVIQPGGTCNETAGASALRAWADDVAGVIRSVDPNHLISLGTGLQGGCGYQVTSTPTSNDFGYVHAGPNIDLCEYHDYAQAYNALPLAEQEEMDTCQADGKAFFVGETGIPSSDQNRKSEFNAKFAAQFGYANEPAQGELIWDWCVTGGLSDEYCVKAGDPSLSLLSQY